jgi:oligopeptidase B
VTSSIAAHRVTFQPCQRYPVGTHKNVTKKAYPHIFAYGGLTDPRVTYWEPAKWIARLRERNTSGNMVLLKTNMEGGHGGASGRFDSLKEIAVDYAFALKVAGKVGV